MPDEGRLALKVRSFHPRFDMDLDHVVGCALEAAIRMVAAAFEKRQRIRFTPFRLLDDELLLGEGNKKVKCFGAPLGAFRSAPARTEERLLAARVGQASSLHRRPASAISGTI